MSLKNKLAVLTLGAMAAIPGLSLHATSLKNAAAVLASAVWGS